MQDDLKTRAVFAATMYGIAEDFGGTISENGLSMRFEVMKEYSIDQITAAGTWLLKHRTEKFPAVPTTKEFISLYKAYSEQKTAEVLSISGPANHDGVIDIRELKKLAGKSAQRI